VEIVAPERENPRNGKQSPCTDPGRAGCADILIGCGRLARRDDDQDARCREAGRYELRASEQLFDFEVRTFPSEEVLDCLQKYDTDNSCAHRRECDQFAAREKRFAGAKVRITPGTPEIDDDREHRPGMKHHEEQCHVGRSRVESEQLFREDDVRRARDGQQFRQPLDDREDQDVKEVHLYEILTPMFRSVFFAPRSVRGTAGSHYVSARCAADSLAIAQAVVRQGLAADKIRVGIPIQRPTAPARMVGQLVNVEEHPLRTQHCLT